MSMWPYNEHCKQIIFVNALTLGIHVLILILGEDFVIMKKCLVTNQLIVVVRKVVQMMIIKNLVLVEVWNVMVWNLLNSIQILGIGTLKKIIQLLIAIILVTFAILTKIKRPVGGVELMNLTETRTQILDHVHVNKGIMIKEFLFALNVMQFVKLAIIWLEIVLSVMEIQIIE